MMVEKLENKYVLLIYCIKFSPPTYAFLVSETHHI